LPGLGWTTAKTAPEGKADESGALEPVRT